MVNRDYIIRRLGQLVLLYFLVATVLWLLFYLSPGSPANNFIATGLTEAQIRSIEDSFGLNEPWYVQYLKWLRNAATLQFGLSYITHEPVIEMISARFWNTIILMGTSIVCAYLIAVPIGAYAGWNRGKGSEKLSVILALVSRSAPVFWTGILAIWIFGLKLDLLPAGSMISPGVEIDSKLALYTSKDFLTHLILPAMVQAFYSLSLPILLMRSSMIDVLNEDFINFAHLKGVNDRSVMIKHAARNALLPVVTTFAIAAAYVIGASVVIESVFAWPGIGRLMVRSVLQNDYPVAQGVFMILAMMVIVANFLADMAYGYLDPRITYD